MVCTRYLPGNLRKSATSPEPFTNWILSSVEDVVAVGLAWMAAEHPLITGAIVLVLVIVCVFVIWKLFSFFKQAIGRIRSPPVPDAGGTGAGPG